MIETALVNGALLGMEDFPAFVPPGGNVGRPGADFGVFENYQRGYFIIDTGTYGLVPTALLCRILPSTDVSYES